MSLGLVNYGSSDSEESDSETNVNSAVSKESHSQTESNNSVLFSKLPAPKAATYSGFSALRSTSNTKKSALLSIPSLDDFSDDDDEDSSVTKKKLAPSKKGSGLLGILPPPNTGSLTRMVPQSVARRPAAPSTTAKRKAPQPEVNATNRKRVKEAVMQETNVGSDDDDDGGAAAGSGGFFTFDEPSVPKSKLEEMVATEQEILQRRLAQSEREKVVRERQVEAMDIAETPSDLTWSSGETSQTATGDSLPINGEALQRLRGRRGEEIVIRDVDVSADVAEARANLVKGLTAEHEQPMSSADTGPSSKHRSKHHILSLAHQAKARETLLKNQWAANKQTKRETQMKYGF